MSHNSRKNYSPEEKVLIFREHLIDHDPVSKVCDRHRLQPTVFYRWPKELFENGHLALQGNDRHRTASHVKTIAALEQRLSYKDGVIAELMGEYVDLQKKLGVR